MYVNNYNLKFNQKIEKNVDIDSTIIRNLLKNWENIPKVFRYKKIYQYVSIDGNFSIDCSVVKSSNFEDNYLSIEEVLDKDLINNVLMPEDSKDPFKVWWKKTSRNLKNKVKVRKLQVYYKSIKDSKVFENNILYEVEIEYIGNKKPVELLTNKDQSKEIDFSKDKKKIYIRDIYLNSSSKDKIVSNLFNHFFMYIGIVLQSVQDSFYLISNEEKKKIYNDFTKLTKINRPLENIFFGPLPMDLDKNKMIKYMDSIYEDVNKSVSNGNILLDYCVTEKSDGLRALLFVDNDGEVHLINRDSNSVIKKCGLKIKKYANSIFDGEYIEYSIDKRFINSFYVFDAYFVQNENIMSNKFGIGKQDNGRLSKLQVFCKYIDIGEDVNYADENFIFRINSKNFEFGALSSTNHSKRNYNLIFEKSKKLLNKMNIKYGGFLKEGHLYNYETDGLIYTPVNLGVYQTNLNNKVPEYLQINSKRWKHVYKWKDSHHLTIDFRIKFVKNLKDNTREYIFINNQKYLKCKLFCRNYDSFEYGKKKNTSTCIDINNEQNKKTIFKKVQNVESQMSSLLLNNNLELKNLPGEIEFISANPFFGKRTIMGDIQNTVCDCLLPVINEEIKCLNGDIIYDNQVIEFSYDNSKQENELKWIPERLRLNKNPNALNTCLDIWYLINNPIDKNLVANGLEYEEIDNKIELNYYLHKEHYYSTSIKKFNNFCSNYVYEKYFQTLTKPTVLDMACGKMGDFFKYVYNNANTLVGIDINPDNLNNKCDGAATRILNHINKSPTIKQLSERTILILGNICKSMNDGELASDDMSKYLLDILYGKHKPNKEFNRKHGIFYNLSVNGFHVVVCKYAIHYCLNSIQDIETFLENVSSNLKDQGYFIGTCLDGNLILNELNSSDSKLIEGKIDGNLIWSISRNNLTQDELNGLILSKDLGTVGVHSDDYSTSSSHLLGPNNKVNIYFETFNSVSQENLVDIKYIEIKCKEYGLKMLESRLFTEEPGNLMAEFSIQNKEFAKDIKSENALLKWGNYQRYFVFQKVDSMINSEM